LQLRGLLQQTSVHCSRYQPGVLGV